MAMHDKKFLYCPLSRGYSYLDYGNLLAINVLWQNILKLSQGFKLRTLTNS
uniref:Uncharacterized protein n=1 Tax=Rhizophora mucronata TaxID=61149 RepID=A0A2P2NUT2_RHIMU